MSRDFVCGHRRKTDDSVTDDYVTDDSVTDDYVADDSATEPSVMKMSA